MNFSTNRVQHYGTPSITYCSFLPWIVTMVTYHRTFTSRGGLNMKPAFKVHLGSIVNSLNVYLRFSEIFHIIHEFQLLQTKQWSFQPNLDFMLLYIFQNIYLRYFFSIAGSIKMVTWIYLFQSVCHLFNKH